MNGNNSCTRSCGISDGGGCQVRAMYVCMYVCMYVFVCVCVQRITPLVRSKVRSETNVSGKGKCQIGLKELVLLVEMDREGVVKLVADLVEQISPD